MLHNDFANQADERTGHGLESPSGLQHSAVSPDELSKLSRPKPKPEIARFQMDDALVPIALNPDTMRVATLHDDTNVKLWELGDRERVVTLQNTNFKVSCLEFSPDGRHLLIGASDQAENIHDARVWDVERGMELVRLKGHKGRVTQLAFRSDGKQAVTVCQDDRTVRTWNTYSWTELSCLQLPEMEEKYREKIVGIAISPDGARIMSGLYDGTLRVWDASKGTEMMVLKGRDPLGKFTHIAMDQNGKRIVASELFRVMGTGWYPGMDIWDAATGQIIANAWDCFGVASIALSPSGTTAATGHIYGSAQLRDISTGVVIDDLAGEADTPKGVSVHLIAFSLDGRRCLAADKKGLIRIWDTSQ